MCHSFSHIQSQSRSWSNRQSPTDTQFLSSHEMDGQADADFQKQVVLDSAPLLGTPLALSSCPHLPGFAFLAVATEEDRNIKRQAQKWGDSRAQPNPLTAGLGLQRLCSLAKEAVTVKGDEVGEEVGAHTSGQYKAQQGQREAPGHLLQPLAAL